jgi:sialic acid synthase SpsE
VRELTIAGRRIADDAPCYVVAEIGGNHGGDLTVARRLIREAAQCGASAVKFQKRNNATLYDPAILAAPYDNENSFGPTYGAHRATLELSRSQLQALHGSAAASGLTCFSTAFDEASASLLHTLQTPAFKIHSGGLTDLALIRYVAAFGKPVLLSTGGGTLDDIDRAVDVLGDCPHAILHCTASYPLQPEEANLRVIGTLRQRYPSTVIGFSSHSPGIAFSLIAYAFGARIIEMHFTLNRASKGTDHGFSLEPKGLMTLVEDLGKLHLALGDGIKRYYPSELGPISKMRRRPTDHGMQITGARDALD